MAITPLHTRKLTIIAQDPSVKVNGKILRTEVEIPAEELQPGPWGYRVQVVDYDSSTETLYKALEYPPLDGANGDPFKRASDARLLSDPNFHAQNAYAIVMRILARFEFALGRRVSWNLYGHQIKVAPHAFAEANAFYSENDEALMFGYFPGRNGMVYTCLSHDIVAHETTHALLDGLRDRYTDPSSPEQAGFHEGFADIVALLSVFSLPKVVETLIDIGAPRRNPDSDRGGVFDARSTAQIDVARSGKADGPGVVGCARCRVTALRRVGAFSRSHQAKGVRRATQAR